MIVRIHRNVPPQTVYLQSLLQQVSHKDVDILVYSSLKVIPEGVVSDSFK